MTSILNGAYSSTEEITATTRKWTWTQVLASLAVSVASMSVGYTAAYTSPAIASINAGNYSITQQQGPLTSSQEVWIGSLNPFFAIFGAVVGGLLIEGVGRKTTMIIAGPPTIIGWLIIALSQSVVVVYVGRSLGGFFVGVLSLCFPIYLGETLHPEVRGIIGLMPTILGNAALDFCYFLSYFLNWIGLAFVGCLFSVVYLSIMAAIPETPRWHVSKYDSDKAEEALLWLRTSVESITHEIAAIERVQTNADMMVPVSCWKSTFTKRHAKPTLICMALMFFQQMSGISAVIYCADAVFEASGGPLGTYTTQVIVGTVNVAATIASALLVDRLGRKKLLYVSATVMALALVVLGSFFYQKNRGSDISLVSWLPLAAFVVYFVAFSFGFGPVPWLMMGEILPACVRGRSASIVVGFHWCSTFAVTYSYTLLLETIGMEGAMWIYSGFCVAAVFFTWLFVPETMKKSLEELEDLWVDEKDKTKPTAKPTAKRTPTPVVVVPLPPKPKPILVRKDSSPESSKRTSDSKSKRTSFYT